MRSLRPLPPLREPTFHKQSFTERSCKCSTPRCTQFVTLILGTDLISDAWVDAICQSCTMTKYFGALLGR